MDQPELAKRAAIVTEDRLYELRLENRAGLPPALCALVLEFPRDGWEQHANFSGMTRFWMERHVMFRDVLERLRTEARGYLDGQLDAKIFAQHSSRLTGFFLNQLHVHHSIEDQHYFPILAGQAPGLQAGFDLLDGDHHELEPLIEGLAAATNEMLGQFSQADPRDAVGRVEAKLDQFHTFLHRHLTDEEDLVVPTILKYGPPDM